MKKRSLDYTLKMSGQIANYSASESGNIGYVARMMVTASLPYREIQSNEFIRTNGRYRLTVLAPSAIGLPFGQLPRRLLIKLVSQAKILKTREIFLGDSVAALMRMLGKRSTGGRNGSLTTLRNQAQRLFSSAISISTEKDGEWSVRNMTFTREARMLWQPISGNDWNSKVILDEAFYEDIQASAVPVDLRVIDACSHYPLAMDIYCWLTYRYYSMKTPTQISWSQLSGQFGSEISRPSNFRRKFCSAIARVSLLYPDAKFSISNSGLLLYPSRTHVPRANSSYFSTHVNEHVAETICSQIKGSRCAHKT